MESCSLVKDTFIFPEATFDRLYRIVPQDDGSLWIWHPSYLKKIGWKDERRNNSRMVDQMDAGKLLARNGCSEPSINLRKHRTKINVKGRTLNNGINTLKYRQIYMYIYVDYPAYKILHMVMGIKFRTTQDVRASDSCN